MSGRILVTGGRGFIGRRLVTALQADGACPRVLTRQTPAAPSEVQGDVTDVTALARACEGVETVFHCAGHAHAFKTHAADEIARHWAVNFEGSVRLIDAAAAAGVRRLVFLSSVKAVGEPGDAQADETWSAAPEGAYGAAKRAAEAALLEAGGRHGLHVVILRPVMVYGAGGRGNLERMARLVRRGCFPPLPETGNRRSVIHVDDVVSALRVVASDPRAAGRTYILAHPIACSGRALYDELRRVMGLAPIAWAVPARLLQAAAWLADGCGGLAGLHLPFNGEVLDRLLGSACYSSERIRMELGWQARVVLADGLKEMLGGR
ncbi:MAG TPA: NAD-dependent epimerase/dehydratase family protein [Rhodocyclaceae bacterium]|nr:NAD-dependent epimerase/dehydratase family protein [Rhodocyclaceae bacterium]